MTSETLPKELIRKTQDLEPEGNTLSVSPFPSLIEYLFSRGFNASIFLLVSLELFVMELIKPVFCYDSEGFYSSQSLAQRGKDSWIFPPNSTEIAPEIDAEHWARFVNGKWEQVKKPTTVEECAALTVSHTSNTPHDIECREIMKKLLEGSDTYRLELGTDKVWRAIALPPLTPEEIAEKELQEAKSERAENVGRIVVEVDGLKFDGDEESQSRMTRALQVAEYSGLTTTRWVLADNTVHEVTKEQLKKALTEAILKQSELWVKPYEE